METLLTVDDLKISYKSGNYYIKALDGVSFEIKEGESLAIVGESGSGKSTLGMAIARLLPPNAIIEKGRIVMKDIDILNSKPDSIRGKLISMIPQEVGTALSPFHKISTVFEDVMASENKATNILNEASKILAFLGFKDPERILKSYPHELSGGMLQRVLLALAIIKRPYLIIADEPTSMVDAPLRINIVEILNAVRKEFNISMIIITHDIAITPHLCDNIVVMYAGKIMEYGKAKEIIDNPLNPYTKLLINSIPRIKTATRFEVIERKNTQIQFYKGCPFADRCESFMKGICDITIPRYTSLGNRKVLCHLYNDKK